VRNLLLTATLVVGLTAGASLSAARKDKSAPKNQSIDTQRQTAESHAKRLGKAPTTQKSEKPQKPEKSAPARDSSAALEQIDQQLAAEEARHAKAAAELAAQEQQAAASGKEKEIAKARKAVKREQTIYEQTKASLQRKREKLQASPPADEAARQPKAAPKRK
jgi:hypothetical protein